MKCDPLLAVREDGPAQQDESLGLDKQTADCEEDCRKNEGAKHDDNNREISPPYFYFRFTWYINLESASPPHDDNNRWRVSDVVVRWRHDWRGEDGVRLQSGSTSGRQNRKLFRRRRECHVIKHGIAGRVVNHCPAMLTGLDLLRPDSTESEHITTES